jgi:LacI family transcriptional regulator
MSDSRRVALIYDAKLPYDVKVMRGVGAYLHEHGQWNVYIEERALEDQQLPDLRVWRGDGIIADFDAPRIATAVSKAGIPIVGFGGGYGWHNPASTAPYFFANNVAIARMAFEHLVERGFRNFAFCGFPRTAINGWSEERASAFADYVAKAGFTCATYRGRHKTSRAWESLYLALCRWLESLPKPLGLMAANDKRARQVVEACRIAGLRIPDDVAVVGVDNDEMLCELSHPSLSSIEQGCRQLGYQAAALLDEMMCGKEPRRREFLVDPEAVFTRHSSDVLVMDDSVAAAVLAVVREQACSGAKVDDIVRSMPLSRSTLERRFKRAVGRSVSDELRRVRLERAKNLVSKTSLPLKEIAARCGFTTVQHMTALFHQMAGQPPAEFRRCSHLWSSRSSS